MGRSITISLAEAQQIHQEGANRLVVGTGHFDRVRLSAEAAEFFNAHNLEVNLVPTPLALEVWNKSQGAVIGLFHLTC